MNKRERELEKRWVPAILDNIDRTTPGGVRRSRGQLARVVGVVAKIYALTVMTLCTVVVVSQVLTKV